MRVIFSHLSLFVFADLTSPQGTSFSSDHADSEAAGLGDGVTREEIEAVSHAFFFFYKAIAKLARKNSASISPIWISR